MVQSTFRIAATRSFASSAYRQKSALVTGAVQGLGEAIARRLADDGYKVVIADVQDGQPLADEIKGKFVKTDVTLSLLANILRVRGCLSSRRNKKIESVILSQP